MSKTRFKGSIKLPIVGKNPNRARIKFVALETNGEDLFKNSQAYFDCDENGSYDFEVYTGKHIFSITPDGLSWAEPVSVNVEPLPENISSIELNTLIDLQELPESDSVLIKYQELLLEMQHQRELCDIAKTAAEEARDVAQAETINRVIMSHVGDFTHYANGNNAVEVFIPIDSSQNATLLSFELRVFSGFGFIKIIDEVSYRITLDSSPYSSNPNSHFVLKHKIIHDAYLSTFLAISNERREPNGFKFDLHFKIWDRDLNSQNRQNISVHAMSDIFARNADIRNIQLVNPSYKQFPSDQDDVESQD